MWHIIWNIFFSNISMVTMPYPKFFVWFPPKNLTVWPVYTDLNWVPWNWYCMEMIVKFNLHERWKSIVIDCTKLRLCQLVHPLRTGPRVASLPLVLPTACPTPSSNRLLNPLITLEPHPQHHTHHNPTMDTRHTTTDHRLKVRNSTITTRLKFLKEKGER